MNNDKILTRLTPRAIAQRFTGSVWLTVLCAALVLSAGLTMFGGLQDISSKIAGVGVVTVVFNAMYALAAIYLTYRLMGLRGMADKDKCRRAQTAALVMFIVLLATVAFLAMFYYTNYTVLSPLTAEQLVEAGLTQEDVDGMWALLPYLILSMVTSALETAAMALFWQTIKRVGILCGGRKTSRGVLVACTIVALLAVGMELCMMIVNIRVQPNTVYAVLSLISSLPGAAVYVSIAVLAKQLAADLQA